MLKREKFIYGLIDGFQTYILRCNNVIKYEEKHELFQRNPLLQ